MFSTRWRVCAIVAVSALLGGVPAAHAQPGILACGDRAFNAEAVLSGSTWTARNGSRTVYTGGDMRSAVQAAVNSLTAGRTSKQWVVVRGNGSVSAGSRISLPSYTGIDVCGTINVTGTGSGDQAPIYSRGTRDVEVRYLSLTGRPLYGIFMRNVDNLILGQIDMRLSGGLGVRIDNRGNTSVRSRNIRIDNVFVSGAWGTLTLGDTNGADEQWVGDVPGNFSLTGLTDINETRFVSNGGSFGHDGGEVFAADPFARPTVRYDFDYRGFGLSVSTDRDLADIAVGAGYAGDLAGGSWSLGAGYYDFDGFTIVGEPELTLVGDDVVVTEPVQAAPGGEQWSVGLEAEYESFGFGVTYITLDTGSDAARGRMT